MKRKRELAQWLAERITEKEDEVFPYIGNNSYVLDQNGLLRVLEAALRDFDNKHDD